MRTLPATPRCSRGGPTTRASAVRRLLLALPLLPVAFAARPAPVLAQDPSFTVVNRSGRTVRELYASPATRRDWGPDRLGDDVLRPGRTFAVRMPPGSGCRTDLRAVFEGGGDEERRNLDTCATTDVVLGQNAAPPGAARGKTGSGAAQTAGNPSFNLRNAGRRTLRELYASPTTQGDWGRDRLGDQVVEPGASFAIRLPEGPCRYDVRVVWDDNQDEERRDLDLCGVADLSFR